uniref:CMP/dCMP-type deaminase domain-containing protein n=1 Tax=Terrapene triunguis TaxID=2587831 RepID=A0A674JK82_9SAUR
MITKRQSCQILLLPLFFCVSLCGNITHWTVSHISGGRYNQRCIKEVYDPSALPKMTHLCCHSTRTEHAEIHFIEDVFQEQRSDPSVHCSITWYMSWSPCGDCCKEIRDFLKEQPNVNLVIYVARLYWHKEETNRQGLRSLMNIGVSIRVMDLPGNDSWNKFQTEKPRSSSLPLHPILNLETLLPDPPLQTQLPTLHRTSFSQSPSTLAKLLSGLPSPQQS